MKVLWVDDNELIRFMGTEMLQSLGCETKTTGSATAAMTILESEGADLLISDISMPDMSGWELMDRIKDRYPAMKRIILSGWDEVDRVEKMARLRVDQLMKKPVRLSDLSEMIKKLRLS